MDLSNSWFAEHKILTVLLIFASFILLLGSIVVFDKTSNPSITGEVIDEGFSERVEETQTPMSTPPMPESPKEPENRKAPNIAVLQLIQIQENKYNHG